MAKRAEILYQRSVIISPLELGLIARRSRLIVNEISYADFIGVARIGERTLGRYTQIMMPVIAAVFDISGMKYLHDTLSLYNELCAHIENQRRPSS